MSECASAVIPRVKWTIHRGEMKRKKTTKKKMKKTTKKKKKAKMLNSSTVLSVEAAFDRLAVVASVKI